MNKLDRTTVKNFVGMIEGDCNVTCWKTFARDEKYIWAFVFGYVEEDDKEYIGVKIAYCPRNSFMNEYKWDWMLPYDKGTGEVDDTEILYEIQGGDYRKAERQIIQDIEWHNGEALHFKFYYVGKYEREEN